MKSMKILVKQVSNGDRKAYATLFHEFYTPLLFYSIKFTKNREASEDIIQDLDMVLLMSVNPGFGGQRFIEHSVNKTARLKEMIRERGLDTLIEVDGGVNLETGKRLLEAGADVLVAASFVFSSPDPIQTIKELKEM